MTAHIKADNSPMMTTGQAPVYKLEAFPKSYIVDVGNEAADKVETYYRTAKVIYRVIDFIAAIGDVVSRAFLNLSSELRATTEFIECTRFWSVLKDLISGKFWKESKWQKMADRITLACHSFLKMVGAGLKYGLYGLGKLAKYSVGQLPVFKLVTDGFYAVSSFFAAWDAKLKINQLNADVAHVDGVILNWERFYLQQSLLVIKDKQEIGVLKKKYENIISKRTTMIDKNKASIKKLEDGYAKALRKAHGDVAKLPNDARIIPQLISKIQSEQRVSTTRIEVSQARLAKIEAKDFEGLANELKGNLITNSTAPTEDVKKELAKAVDAKIKKWEHFKQDKLASKQRPERASSWMKIAASVCKIAVISLALTLTAINLWTFPLLMTVVSLGLLGDSISFIRIFHDRYKLRNPVDVAIAAC